MLLADAVSLRHIHENYVRQTEVEHFSASAPSKHANNNQKTCAHFVHEQTRNFPVTRAHILPARIFNMRRPRARLCGSLV